MYLCCYSADKTFAYKNHLTRLHLGRKMYVNVSNLLFIEDCDNVCLSLLMLVKHTCYNSMIFDAINGLSISYKMENLAIF